MSDCHSSTAFSWKTIFIVLTVHHLFGEAAFNKVKEKGIHGYQPGQKHVLHQIPSGIFRPETKNIIGNGLVIDPVVFQREIESLDKYNLNVKGNLFISKKAHLILPTHKILDAAYETLKGDKKIGSTLRGIGPAYQSCHPIVFLVVAQSSFSQWSFSQ